MSIDIVSGEGEVFRSQPRSIINEATRRGLSIPKAWPMETAGAWRFNSKKDPFVPDVTAWTGNAGLHPEECALMAVDVLEQTDVYFNRKWAEDVRADARDMRRKVAISGTVGTLAIAATVASEVMHGNINGLASLGPLATTAATIRTIGILGTMKQFNRRLKEATPGTPEREKRNERLKAHMLKRYKNDRESPLTEWMLKNGL